MILNSIEDSSRIESLHPLFKKLFDYIKTHDLSKVPTGRIKLDGDNLFINIDDATLVDAEKQRLEVHRAYIDIHFPLNGDETVGWRAINTLHIDTDAPFNTEKDFAFYSAPGQVYFTAHPGEFYVMFPEDAHAPIIGEGKLRKAVAKIKI